MKYLTITDLEYRSVLSKLYSINTMKKFDLRESLQLQSLLNYPDRKFKSIHVAGTNGKGSVSLKIAHTLNLLGYKVGLFTSPHISTCRERIRINNNMISKSHFTFFVNEIFSKIKKNVKLQPSFFEIITNSAFKYFESKNVDYAVIEVGLGGRLDATNIITPILSIITSIDLDHTHILGDTVKAITKEKAGILKKNVPAVIGPNVNINYVSKKCEKLEVPLVKVNKIYNTYDDENSEIAKVALLNIIKSKINKDILRKGISYKEKCRFEEINIYNKTVILDVAHNPNAFNRLLESIEYKYKDIGDIKMIIGFNRRKDIKSCLKVILGFKKCTSVYLVTGYHAHLLKEEEITNLAESDERIKCISRGKIEETITKLLKESNSSYESKNVYLICGSFYIMTEVRKSLGINEEKDYLDTNER